MKPNFILFLGSIIVVISTLLWYLDFIEEPIAAFAGALLTSITYYFINKEKPPIGNLKNNPQESNTIIHQEHLGEGDNIGKDKIILKKGTSNQVFPSNSLPAKTKITQKHTGNGDNVGGNKVIVK